MYSLNLFNPFIDILIGLSPSRASKTSLISSTTEFTNSLISIK